MRNNIPCTYALENSGTGERYYGSTAEYHRRVWDHFSRLKRGKHPNRFIQRDYNEGADIQPVLLEHLPGSTRHTRLEQERKLIAADPTCYNISDGGARPRKQPLTGEQRKPHPQWGRLSPLKEQIRADPRPVGVIAAEHGCSHTYVSLVKGGRR